MSENHIYLVIKDKDYVPTQQQHEKAVELWQKMIPTYDAVISEKSDKFGGLHLVVDNLYEVTCPKCHAKTDITLEENEWIREKIYADNPENTDIVMPCCHNTIKVTDLDLGDCGTFTRYDLVAYEPSMLYEYWESEGYAEEYDEDMDFEDGDFEDPMPYGENLTQETLDKFAEILGSPVKVVWRRI